MRMTFSPHGTFSLHFRAAPERRAKLDRNRERDISEQIALGIPAKTSATGEGLFDARYIHQFKFRITLPLP